MDNKHTDDENEIMAKNYSKLLGATTKIGYKDGVYDGRNSVFQNGFDVGYSQGFKNAFTIGTHQGLLAAVNELKKQNTLPKELEPFSNAPHSLILNKATRGQCQICQDPNLLNQNLSVITTIQTKHANNIKPALEQKHELIINHFQLNNKLN